MSARILFAVLFASSTALFACTVAPEASDDGADPVDGELGEASSALANTGGGGGNGLTAGECTGCGCRLVLDRKDDNCRYYKCVCDTPADAECAGGKARIVSVPNPKRSVVGVFGGSTSVLSTK